MPTITLSWFYQDQIYPEYLSLNYPIKNTISILEISFQKYQKLEYL